MPVSASTIQSIQPAAADLDRLATLWNRQFSDELPASPRLLAWTLAAHPGRSVSLLCLQKREVQAYAIVSKLEGSPIGVVDALVTTERSGRASAMQLVQAVEEWLRTQGATAIQFGGGAYSLLRGISGARARALNGWVSGISRVVHEGGEFDLALDVSRYVPPTEYEPVAGVVQTAQGRDRDELTAFFGAPAFIQIAAANAPATVDDLALAQEVAFDGRIGDLMVLYTARGIEGVCHLIFADSAVPIELAYPYTLAKPWGAIGMVACAERLGNVGYAALLDAAIRRMHNNGINSAVVMGVSAPLIYESFGFVQHRAWRQRVRAIEVNA